MEHSYNQVGVQSHSPTVSAAYGFKYTYRTYVASYIGTMHLHVDIFSYTGRRKAHKTHPRTLQSKCMLHLAS